jgi:hypothetical protein
MTEPFKKFIQYGRVWGGILGLVGYAIAVGLLLALLPQINPSAVWLFVGAFVGVMYCAIFGGSVAARLIYDGANPYWSGMVLAICSGLVPTFCLALPFAMNAGSWPAFIKTLLMPLYFVWLFGGLPMLVLGLLFGVIMGRREENLTPSMRIHP